MTKEQENFIIDNYQRLGRKTCADELKIPVAKVINFARRNKLKIDKDIISALRKSEAENRGDTKINPDLYNNISTFEMAYLLGLLWADGYVMYRENEKGVRSRGFVKISLKTPDMEKIMPTILQTGDWCINSWLKMNQTYLTMSSINFVKFLIRHDYEVKSGTSPDKILGKIPNELHYAWFLGYLDGDGYIYVPPSNRSGKIEFSSVKNQNWNFLNSLCLRLNIKGFSHPKTNKKGGSSSFLFWDKKSVITFGRFIYSGRIILQRKYEKFMELERRNLSSRKRIIF